MKLTGMFLYPDLVEYRSGAAQEFRNQTRFICHYLQRHVAARKVQTEGFNKICVVCKRAPAERAYKNSSNALISEVGFDMGAYEQLAAEQLPEYFIALLEAGLAKCSQEQHISNEYFQEAIQSFRADHYKNEWVYAEKTFRAAGIQCRLRCALDLSDFRLTLEIEHNGALVFSQEILSTLPDEIAYAHRFKDIVLDDDAVIVRDKFGQPLVAVPLGDL